MNAKSYDQLKDIQHMRAVLSSYVKIYDNKLLAFGPNNQKF